MRLFLVFCIVALSASAQEYISLDTLDQKEGITHRMIFENKISQFERKLKTKYSDNISNELIRNLKDFETFFIKTFDRGEYFYKTPFNEKVAEVFKEIASKNGIVPNDFQVLVSRKISLNAYCFANGTMIVNSGAIHYLENDNQLAAILCHEIAHKLLDHSEKDVVAVATEKFSKETRKKNRSIKRQRFNQQKTAFSILKEKLISNSKENQQQELEADSLGYRLLRNTKYSPSEFVKALELSFQYDTVKPVHLDVGIYKEVFDLPNQPFNKKWLEQEDFSGYDYVFEEKIAKDSLRTHPKMEQRIKRLFLLFPELEAMKNDSIGLAVDDNYLKLRKMARNEQAPNLFHLKKYGFCIYLCLVRIQQNELVDYHKKWMGHAFEEMYKARKNYMANKYLDRVNPEEQSESYKQFINFMWNLRLEEIEKIANYYSGL